LYSESAEIDVDNPISLRDLAEIDPGRFAFMAMLPDNPVVLGPMDIIVATPEATVGVVYQNCALAATLSTPASAFQWLLDGQPIQGANQGVYFPTKPGLYEVQILDDKGCFGVSDTFRVEGPVADFTASSTLLSTTFTNASQGAVSYAWNFGDGATSTQANPIHTYTATGVFNVRLIVTNSCGLKDTILQQVGVTPSEEPSWLDYFSLAPNPTSGAFTVEMNGTPQNEIAFTVFNMIGQKVGEEALSFQNGFLLKTFDMGNLPGGVYVVQIQSGKQAKKVRVLKQ
jgi:hypothetical protein